MSAFDDVVTRAEAAKARERSIRVLVDQGLAERHADLDAQLLSASDAASGSLRGSKGAASKFGLAEEVIALEEEIEAAKVPFTFRAISKKAWADLLAKHPPTKQQKAAHGRVDFNPDTFPIAAMAALCVEPEGATLEGFQRLNAAPTLAAAIDAMWTCCLDAQLGGGGSPKSAAAASLIRLKSGASESTPAAEASLEASFSAGS